MVMVREPASADVRRHVIYAGNVQGVGFRFTTRELSRRFTVGGFVRNLADGTVELEVQGAADEVRRFLDAIRERLGRNIGSEHVSDHPPTTDASRFEIVY